MRNIRPDLVIKTLCVCVCVCVWTEYGYGGETGGNSSPGQNVLTTGVQTGQRAQISLDVLPCQASLHSIIILLLRYDTHIATV